MKIEFAVPFRRVPAPMTVVAEPAPEPRAERRESRGFWRSRTSWTRWSGRAQSPVTASLLAWATSPRRVLLKSWFCCIWHRRFRSTFCFSPRPTLDSSASWGCERSRVSRAGIASANFSRAS